MMSNEGEIDAILDAALDELDDSDDDCENDTQLEPQPSIVTSGCTGVGSSINSANTESTNIDENQKKKAKAGETKKVVLTSGRPLTPPAAATESLPMPMGDMNEVEMLDNMMKELFSDGAQLSGDASSGGETDEFLGQLLQGMQSQIAEIQNKAKAETQEVPSSSSKNSQNACTKSEASPKKRETPQKSANKSSDNEVDQAICNLLDGMAKHEESRSPTKPNDGIIDEEHMLKEMMAQFENLGGNHSASTPSEFNADSIIDGMMEQLLSKELMYEPMKQVTEKFPQWLEEHKDTITEEEYKQRCKQYEYFQKLVHVYESNPENVQTLMILMQELQEYGQPPKEIIQQIAPGLQLDSDGLPNLEDDGVLPPFFTGGGLPGASGNEECCLM